LCERNSLTLTPAFDFYSNAHGNNLLNILQNRYETSRTTARDAVAPSGTLSRKQGPSHRKARRWNNDNFANLAAEISAGRGSGSAAAAALLHGSAHKSKYRSILDEHQHRSKVMTQFREDDSLGSIRQKFFEGELPNQLHPITSPHPSTVVDFTSLTPLERFHRIDNRLRRILVKACDNSCAATKVVDMLEEFLILAHSGNNDKFTRDEWHKILLGPPTVTSRGNDTECNDGSSSSRSRNTTHRMTRFLFDADSATGGFHRLLLGGVCQFHGLRSATSTMDVMVGVVTKKARVLTATGFINRAVNISLTEFISSRQKSFLDGGFTDETHLASTMSSLKV
jgi:hypothetical protein